jgi:hypothetical protein
MARSAETKGKEGADIGPKQPITTPPSTLAAIKSKPETDGSGTMKNMGEKEKPSKFLQSSNCTRVYWLLTINCRTYGPLEDDTNSGDQSQRRRG